MKIKLAKKYINLFLALVAASQVLILSGCQSRAEKFYKQAQVKIQERQFQEASILLDDSASLEKNMRLKSRTQFELARIYRFELQEYTKALDIFKQIILKSDDSVLRIESQKAIAEIYFENLQNYTQAIKEYLLLESLVKNDKELEDIRLKIAQGYRYVGLHKTALEYIEVYIRGFKYQKPPLMWLKAQTLVSLSRYDEAIHVYDEIYKDFQNYFLKENLFLAIAVVYEEKEDYKSAIQYLNENKDKIKDQTFVELRLKRLLEKQLNKPFTKGVRK